MLCYVARLQVATLTRKLSYRTDNRVMHPM